MAGEKPRNAHQRLVLFYRAGGVLGPGYRTELNLKRHCFRSRTDSTAITIVVVVVIVIIPIPLGVPAVVIFTPPTMAAAPAMLAGFV